MKRRDFIASAIAVGVATRAEAQVVPNAPVLSLAAYDFYISPTGDDNNPGTQSSPWSITALNNNRSQYAGKRVGLMSGTYQYGTKGGVQTTLYSLVNGANVYEYAAISIQGGSASSPTLVQSITPRAAVISAADPSSGALPGGGLGGIIGQGSSGANGNNNAVSVAGNFILDGVTVTGSNNGSGVTVVPRIGSGPGGGTGCVVRNCEIYGIGGNESGNMGAVFAYWCTGLLVQNCKLHDIVPTSGNVADWDCAAIMVQECVGNIYEYNTIYNCNDGIYDKNSVQGSTYRYNYIEVLGTYQNTGTEDGNSGPAGTTMSVYNNIWVSPTGHWATSALSPNPPSGVCNWVVYNNTYYCPTGGWGAQGSTCATLPTTGSLSFYNNICAAAANGGSNGILGYLSAPSPCNYNVYQGTSGGNIYGVWSSTSSYASSFHPLGYNGLDANSVSLALGTLFGNSYTKIANGGTAAQFKTVPSAISTLGHVGGVSTGAAIAAGAWGGTDVSLYSGQPVRQIGCNF